MSDRPGSPRPPKPPFIASRVLKALPVRVLSQGKKLVWLEIYGLDQGHPDGCYIGATPLARRLGVSTDQVEQDRRELQRLGLLRTVTRPGKRTASWYVVLPPECWPADDRPKDADLLICAETLARMLTQPAEQTQPVQRFKIPATGGAGSAGSPSSIQGTGVAGSAGRSGESVPTGGVSSASTSAPAEQAPPVSTPTGVADSAGGVPDWRSLLRPGGFQPLSRLENNPTSEVGPVQEPVRRSDNADTPAPTHSPATRLRLLTAGIGRPLPSTGVAR